MDAGAFNNLMCVYKNLFPINCRVWHSTESGTAGSQQSDDLRHTPQKGSAANGMPDNDTIIAARFQ